MQLPYSAELDVGYLNRIFDNKNECYKLFWFQAIVNKILAGRERFTFEELVDEMIASAWYMVSEYHLNLGPKDNLEAVVTYISRTEHFRSAEKKEVLLEYLKTCQDREVRRRKRVLIQNVPYRMQSPFLPEIKGKAWDGSKGELIHKINSNRRLIYYMGRYDGLHTEVRIQPDWLLYLQKNGEVLQGWIRYHLIQYLQRRNPGIPGIVDKLNPPQERKLEDVRKYWRMILEFHPIREIYGQRELTEKDISIDHFVPWSYVAHDELWNLHPTTKEINSGKGNHLPDWEKYFPLLCGQEYLSYTMIWQYEKIHGVFEKCAREHLNDTQIRSRLYREGQTKEEFSAQLAEVLLPVYRAAKCCGFDNWVLQS